MKPSLRPSRRLPRLSSLGVHAFVGCFLLCGISSAKPSITLSKETGPPTSQILVSGSGFEPNVGVDIYFDTRDEALIVTDGRGKFVNAKAHAPRRAHPGKHWITVLQRNSDKGAQKSFMVFTDWPQFGFSPNLSGFNSYENVLSKNNVAALDVAWTYARQTPYDQFSSPATWEGKVYVTFAGGTLYAFDAKTGRVLWTHNGVYAPPAIGNSLVYAEEDSQAGTHALALEADTGAVRWSKKIELLIIGQAPTVDHGKVFFGGSPFYALNATTGAFLWSFRLAGYVGTAVSNNVVYACFGDHGSGAGACYALDEKTGQVLWQYSVTQGAILGAPAVAYGLVFFEEENQGVFALDARSGVVVWQYPDGIIWGSPTVANGKVYVVGNGGLRALDAFTGKLLWTSLYGGVTSAAIANGVVYSIDAIDGTTIDALDADTGLLLWSYPVGFSSIYSPAVANGWLFVPAFDYPQTLVYAFHLKHAGAAHQLHSVDRPSFSTLHPDLRLGTGSNR